MTAATWSVVDRILRGDARPRSLFITLTVAVAAGAAYGAIMGSFAGTGAPRPLMMLYAAIKVPILIVVTVAFVLPSWYVLHALLGLRDDLPSALRALTESQAAVAVTLLACAPLTLLWYASTAHYESAILTNGVMFAVASFGGQIRLRRAYAPLVARNPRHRWTLVFWLAAYIFIAIQMAWLLRPFVGDPDLPTQFTRPGAWDNAYVIVGRMLMRTLTGASE